MVVVEDELDVELEEVVELLVEVVVEEVEVVLVVVVVVDVVVGGFARTVKVLIAEEAVVVLSVQIACH